MPRTNDGEGCFVKKRLAVLLGVVSLMAVTVAPAQAHTAPDRTQTVAAGTTFNWAGSTATGLNQNYWGGVDEAGLVIPVGHCDKSVLFYCDTVLIGFNNPLTAEEIAAGKTTKTKSATISIDQFPAPGDPVQDFDLLVYESDVLGMQYDEIGHDGTLDPQKASEQVGFSITTTQSQPTKWVLVHVVYYSVINGSYSGHAFF